MKTPSSPFDGTRQALVLTLSVTLSILSGFIPSWTKVPFSTADQTLLTVGLFIVFLLLDLLWIVKAFASDRRRDVELWQLRWPGEEALANIRADFVGIVRDAHGAHDLFVSHFIKEFQKLRQKISDAAEKKELRVVSDYYLNDDEVFRSFLSNQNEPVLRYTWPIEADERLFTEHAWRRYFEVVAHMANEGMIAMIRVILIIDDINQVSDARMVKLLHFFKTAERQECRLISKADFVGISSETGIPTSFLDFGIYGDRMLFRSEQYAPQYAGVFSKDVTLIRTYEKFFDTLWSSAGIVKRNPSVATNAMTFEELVEADV